MQIELLWSDDCPNYEATEQMILDVLDELGVEATLIRLHVANDTVAQALRFPGSPTIRVNNHDVEPGWQDTGEYARRCRVYPTDDGLRGLPERRWLVSALADEARQPCQFPAGSQP